MKHVTVKQLKYFNQIIQENKLPYLLNEEKEVFDSVVKQARDNNLYNVVWSEIETEANRIVDEECKPEWDRLIKQIEEAKTKIIELEKAEEKDEEAIKANQEIIDNAMEQYQKVSDEANVKLNEFKENLLATKYKESYCFDLHDSEYNLIDRVTGWSVYDGKHETNVTVPEADVEIVKKEEEE